MNGNQKTKRQRLAADLAAFRARQGLPPIPVSPVIAMPRQEHLITFGVRLGNVTPLGPASVARHVVAECHLCGSRFECSHGRINNGSAARDGCRCQSGAFKAGVKPPGAAPKYVGPAPRRGTTL